MGLGLLRLQGEARGGEVMNMPQPKKMTQPELFKLLHTSDPVRQHQMLKSIGASPIIDPQTSKLIIYDVAIINRMSTPMTNSPFTINMDAFDGS